MSQAMDDMRRKMNSMLASAEQLEVKLRKTDLSLLNKIEGKEKLREKLNSRCEFYKKLQTDIGRGQEQAYSKLDAADKAVLVVQQKVEALETELRKSKAALDEVIAQNKLNVLPELEELGRLLQKNKDEIAISSRACADDEQRLQELIQLALTIDTEDKELKQLAKDKEDVLQSLRAKPDKHAETLSRARQDEISIKLEIDCINQRKIFAQEHVARETARISELYTKKDEGVFLLNSERQRLEEKRLNVYNLHKKLNEQRILEHDLAAERLETELRIKNAHDDVKHNSYFLTAENRQLGLAKSALVNKQQSLSMLLSSVPLAEAKLHELQQCISIMEAEKQAEEQTLFSIKARVDSCMMNLVSEEYIEKDILDRLHSSSKAVTESESGIERARIEELKANTLVSLTKEKGAITRRKVGHASQLENDLDMEVHIREIRKIELTKKINEAEKKANNYTTLLGMMRGERDKTSRLVDETQKSLSEMKHRSTMLQAELRLRMAERAQKMKLLEEDIGARVASQQMRATKRTEKNEAWSSYRQALEDVERQNAQIDKLNAALIHSKKELERALLQNEQLNVAKEAMSGQLQLRKKQLEEMQIIANKHTETLKKGELGIQQKERDQAALELKVANIQRSIDLLKKDLQNPADIEAKIESVKRKLEVQMLESEQLTRELESPNHDRLRVLDKGIDQSEEELAAKLATLERLVQHKKEVLLAGEISLNDTAFQIQQLEESLQSYKIATQAVLNGINEYQGRIQEKKRLRTAQISEILMYDELIATRQSTVSDLEKNILLREEFLLASAGESENVDASATILRTAEKQLKDSSSPPQTKHQACARPTGYLPGDYDEYTINVPRPYGGHAPFKAGTVKSATFGQTNVGRKLDKNQQLEEGQA
ncbi:hypothetical protein ACHAXA_002661 [Cyclostephanos tholiformis]|uniref:Uncharacterized protein n=1 Tax=Cyclostephanos tholiformis TaxID=382380 RepID=A0ABD3RG28_9STRA